MLVTDRHLTPDLPAAVAAAVAGGVDWVQLRARDLPAGALLALARTLREVIGETARLVINDRVDIALAVEADGVQLPAGGLPVAVARRLLGPAALIGVSVHKPDDARTAEHAGANYVIAGTIYRTRSHPDGPTGGLALLRAIRAATALPVVAIGGITAAQATELRAAGADGIAVISAILSAPDAAAAARALRAAWEAAG